MALDELGATIITDYDSTTEENAIAIRRQWDRALAEFLAASPWSFAKTRERIQAASPAPDFGWAYSFALPEDFVTLVGLNEIYADTPSDLFEIESGYLLTDCVSSGEAIDLEYIAKPTGDTTLAALLDRMDGLALNAFVTLLAARVASRVSQDGVARSSALLQRYLVTDLPRARVRDLNMQRPAPKFPAATSTAYAKRFNFRNG